MSMQELIGTTLGGQYQIEAKVGQGGMAEVFRAYQLSLARHVAIKVLPPSFASQDPDFVRRFKREATAVAQLNHPNILPVYDFGVDEDYSYIVMRYVEGSQTLAHLMKHPLTPEHAVHLVGQVADALAYAHKRGIIHRDVKPTNILLDNDWALLSDFGLAKFHRDTTQLTQAGRSIGTAAYMSPEQSQGKDIDNRTDIYALGVILYQMLTGQIPHDADNPVAIMMQRLTEPPKPPSLLNDSVSEEIEQIILRALSTEKDYRYESATDFSSVLKSTVGGGQIYQTPSYQASGYPQLPAPDTGNYSTGVFSTEVVEVGEEDVLPSLPVTESKQPPRNIWQPILVALAIVILIVSLYSVFQFNQNEEDPVFVSVASITPRITSTPTNTSTHTPTATHTVEPTIVTTAEFLPTLKSTRTVTTSSITTPTQNPVNARSTENAKRTLTASAPTATDASTATNTPDIDATIDARIDARETSVAERTLTAQAASAALTPTPTLTETSSGSVPITDTPIAPTTGPESFGFLSPNGIEEPIHGTTTFEWEWTGALEEGQGFEIRVWLPGEVPQGVHDSVADNLSGKVESLGDNRYKLQANIRDTAGVQNRSGIYFWNVLLVQVDPNYADLGVRSEPAQLRFDATFSGGSSDSGGGGIVLD